MTVNASLDAVRPPKSSANGYKLEPEPRASHEQRTVGLKEAGGQAAVNRRVVYAGIDVEVLVESIVDQERAHIEIAGAVRRNWNTNCWFGICCAASWLKTR